MIRDMAGAVAVTIALVGCGPASQTAAGFVIDVRSESVTEVASFTLRTPEGEELIFSVGPLELDGGAFPAGHLREHMALGQPVAVGFVVQDGDRVASRLVDAPWLRP